MTLLLVVTLRMNLNLPSSETLDGVKDFPSLYYEKRCKYLLSKVKHLNILNEYLPNVIFSDSIHNSGIQNIKYHNHIAFLSVLSCSRKLMSDMQ